VVVSGLVLGALALATTGGGGVEPQRSPANGDRPAVVGGNIQQAGSATLLSTRRR
jgi:hypothetical protein